MARGLTQGWVEQGGNTVTTDGRVSTTLVQRSYPEATVTVFNAGTAVLATIFSTEGGAPLANPFVADGNGKWQFWADQGRYDIQFSGAGITGNYTYFAVEVVPSAAMLPDPGSNGIVVRTALGTTVARTLTQPAAGITITNANGVAGNPTFALANDLAAVEGLATTGMATRTAADTWATRTITGTANNITVTNGDGVAGNPTLNIGANVVTNTANGVGTVVDNALVRMDTTNGRLIQTSPVIVADTTGSFTVPNNWSVTDAAGVAIQLAASGIIVTTPNAAASGTTNSIANGTHTQAAGVINIVNMTTTYNQSATAGSSDIQLTRVETAVGSGEHNFIRMTGGAAGTTLRARIDRLGNIYQGTNPAVIGDANGNEQLRFVTTAAAVNEWTMTNAATGGAPILGVTGGDPNANGRIQAQGTGRIIIPGYAFCLDSNVTPTGNVLGGLDPLYTLSILADTFANNSDFIEFSFGGTVATNDNDKRFVLTLDAQVIFDTGLSDFDGVGTLAQWSITGRAVRITATTVFADCQLMIGQVFVPGSGVLGTSNGLLSARTASITVANLDSNAVTLLFSGEGTATNDIVRNTAIVKITQRT